MSNESDRVTDKGVIGYCFQEAWIFRYLIGLPCPLQRLVDGTCVGNGIHRRRRRRPTGLDDRIDTATVSPS